MGARRYAGDRLVEELPELLMMSWPATRCNAAQCSRGTRRLLLTLCSPT